MPRLRGSGWNRRPDPPPPVAGGTPSHDFPARVSPLPRARSAWRTATVLLAGCFALLLAAGAAQAQTLTPTTVKLVSNTGQPQISGHFNFGADWAFAFTTGSHRSGYVLKRTDIRMSSTASPDYSVTIRSNASGLPGSVVGTLTKPDSYSSTFSLHEFTASAGIELAADTTYWVVFDQDNGDGNTRFSFTQSDAEDADPATGWTIGNQRASRSTDSSSWVAGSTYVSHIAIHGYARLPPTPTFYRASVNGTALTVSFDRDLDASGTMPSSNMFTVTVTPPGGSPRNITGSATPVTIDGSTVTATLSSAVVPGETVTLAYIKPTDNPLRDTDDPPNELEDFSGKAVSNYSLSVTGIDFARVAPRDADRDGSGDSYRTDDVIEVAVTLSGAVVVWGAPTLKLDVGGAERAAAYHSGAGTATLAFRYTVAAGDADADGISVPANPIALNGGRIGNAVVAASLAYGGRAADASRKVDAVAPTRSGSIAFNKANGSAGRGDELRFTVTFSEPVDVTGTPAVSLELTKGGATRHLLAGHAGRTGARALIFSHTVAMGDSGDTALFSSATSRTGA